MMPLEYASKALEFIIEQGTLHKKNIEKGMKEFCKEKFAATYDCLLSIPGIGEATIPFLISYTNNFTRFNNGREFSSYCGTVPNFYESGTSIKYKSKIAHKTVCNKKLRASLAQAAIVAMQERNGNEQCVDLANRLRGKGLKGSQVIIAVARKLAIQAYYCGQNQVHYSKEVA